MSLKPRPVEGPLAVSRKEAARMLGISLSTLERTITRGEIRIIKIGTRVLVPISEIERMTTVQAASTLTLTVVGGSQ